MSDFYPKQRFYSFNDLVSPHGFVLDEPEYMYVEKISDYALNKFLFEGLGQGFTFRFYFIFGFW